MTTIKPRKLKCPLCRKFASVHRDNILSTLYKCENCGHVFGKAKSIPVIAPSNNNPAFFCWNHQGKADPLVQALSTKYEHEEGNYMRPGLSIVLTDSDIRGRAYDMERMRQNGSRAFFVYPHAAPPSLVHCKFSVWQGTTAQLVVSDYHAEVLRLSGYKKPLESVGWYLSEIKPFQSRKIRNVLFAPIHPKNAPIDRRVNADAFQRLHSLARQGAFHLVVRFIGSLPECGLDRMEEGVTYVQGGLHLPAGELDQADLVVAHQTFAWKAVAKGIPVVMMGENMPRHYKTAKDQWEFMKQDIWDQVVDLFRFPYDILDGGDTMTLLERAASSDREIADWKRRMIGCPFQPERFVEIVEKYL